MRLSFLSFAFATIFVMAIMNAPEAEAKAIAEPDADAIAIAHALADADPGLLGKIGKVLWKIGKNMIPGIATGVAANTIANKISN